MSDYETRVGKIKKMDGDFEDIIMEISMLKPIPKYYDKNDFHDIIDFVRNEFNDEFIINDKEVYKVIEDKNLEDEDLFDAKENSDGTIDYTLRYYNGGCGFGEAIAKALERMKNEE